MVGAMRSYCDNGKIEIGKQFESQKQLALNRYGISLAAVMSNLQKAGDLDNYLVVRDEKKRFDADRSIPSEQYSGNTAVEKIRDEYRQACHKAENEKAVRTVALLKQCIARLETQTKELVQAGTIAEAQNTREAANAYRAELTALGIQPDEAKKEEAPSAAADAASASQEMLDVPSKPNSTEQSVIPRDALYWKNAYYKAFHDKVTWQNAAGKCEKLGGHLVVISSAVENDIAAALANGTPMWIGCRNTVSDSIDEDGMPDWHVSWSWCNGETLDYSNWRWRDHQVLQLLRRPSFVQINPNYLNSWDVGNESSTNGFICEWKAPPKIAKPDTGRPALTSSAKKQNIPDDAVFFGGHYYAVYYGEPSWERARKECRKMGGHLVSIESSLENQVVAAIAGKKNTWIGLERPSNRWRWVDGPTSTEAYENWAPGQPDSQRNGQMEENKGAMFGTTFGERRGKWFDYFVTNIRDDDWSVTQYVCEWDN